MVHTINIFMLYEEIIVAIQEHAYDNCCGNVSGHVYIYPNLLDHTLKSFTSIEYEFGMRTKREGTLKVVHCSRRVCNPTGEISIFIESPEYTGRSNHQRWTTMGLGPHGAHPWVAAP
jgi:hypothetical protein